MSPEPEVVMQRSSVEWAVVSEDSEEFEDTALEVMKDYTLMEHLDDSPETVVIRKEDIDQDALAKARLSDDGNPIVE